MKINNTDIDIQNLNEKVVLEGWVSKSRDLGGLLFIDLRDRSGIIQLTFNQDNPFYKQAGSLKNESVIRVSGVVQKRNNPNLELKTGQIEILVEKLEVLNEALDLPFDLNKWT